VTLVDGVLNNALKLDTIMRLQPFLYIPVNKSSISANVRLGMIWCHAGAATKSTWCDRLKPMFHSTQRTQRNRRNTKRIGV